MLQARPTLALTTIAVVLFVTSWASRSVAGRRSIASADAALHRGERSEAIVFARAAAEARCPFCAAPEAGYARLEAIAKDAENQGDDVTAVAAWQAVRAATLATALFDVAPAKRREADATLVRLEHRLDVRAAADGAPPMPAASEPRLQLALANAFVPSGLVYLLLAVGGALFLRGAVGVARTERLRAADPLSALAGIGVAVVGLLLF